MKIVGLFIIAFLMLSVIICNFVNAVEKFNVNMEIVGEEENVSANKEDVNRSPGRSATGLITLDLENTNKNVILFSIIAFFVILIVYIIIKKAKLKRNNERIKNEGK